MKVPFVDLGAQHGPLSAELHEVFERVLRQSSFVQGKEVFAFETDFAEYIGNGTECIAVSSGTAALHLTLLALGVGPGDEVITVANTFIATAEAITAVGATPVFVDVDPRSYTMDPICFERSITPRTRAAIPVHLYGQAADLDEILTIARRHGIPVVEDSCQAHGALYKGRKVGAIGVAGCFSFYPSKNLGCCGEGGAVVTHDADLARRIRLLRDHGSIRKYEHEIPGLNQRMEGLQGAILRVKLKYLDEWNHRRRAIATTYGRLLADSDVVRPAEMDYAQHVYHLYVIQTERRDTLREALTAAEIETGLHYPKPLHLQDAYKSLSYARGDLPVTERLASRILSLPMFPELGVDTAEYVAERLIDALERTREISPGVAAATSTTR
jgi:dTDP-4-amino-4,6-dideoxygalactose transaminase